MPDSPQIARPGQRTRGIALDIALVALVALAALVAAWLLIKPAPPKEIRFVAGAEGGAYVAYAERYAKRLARDGVKVTIEYTPGAVENLKRLADPAGAQVGFVQSGIASEAEREGLVSLGTMFFEPLWVVHRAALRVDKVSDLRGRRVAVGVEGSGSRLLAERLLKESDVNVGTTSFVALPLSDAADALERGDIDALIQVASPTAPVIQRLMRSEGARVLSLSQADAYVRRIPSLAKVTLPAGTIDLAQGIPSRDIVSVSSLAMLVAKDDLHPAIAFLLARAAREIHGDPSLLNGSRAFPQVDAGDEFAVPDEVAAFYKQGPPWLYRHLPFWLANLLVRLWVLIIPIAALALSATDWLPKMLAWQGNRRINEVYRDALQLEALARRPANGEAIVELDAQLTALRERVENIWLPGPMLKVRYEVRTHLDLVAQTIARARERATPR